MNKEQASAKGYYFTGIYERSKADAQIRLDEIRKQNYKAVLVTVPDSPLSRGSVGVGYSVYAEQRHGLDKIANRIRKEMTDYPDAVSRATERFNAELASLKSEQENRQTWLLENGYSV